MTTYIASGKQVRIYGGEDESIGNSLAVGYYNLNMDMNGPYLEKISPFTLPDKIYGDVTDRANRVMQTFGDRTTTTGVLLTGEKGSGKTLLMKMICIKAIERGHPVITINDNFGGSDQINQFLGNIDCSPVIVLDEFDKTYRDTNMQEKLLTLLEGVYTNKKLFLFTSNSTWGLSTFMINRPSRIYYRWDYKGIEEEFIREFALDKLKDLSHVDELVRCANFIRNFNFDMLQVIVEECNRYNENPKKVLEVINATIQLDDKGHYEYRLFKYDKEIPADRLYTSKELYIDPDSSVIVSYWTEEIEVKSRNSGNTTSVRFEPKDLVNVADFGRAMTYENDGYRVELRLPDKTFNYRKLL